MKVSIKYGSHLPVLMKIVQITNGPILELGIGLYSTPFLHYSCLSNQRKLVSFETDHGWARYFRDCKSDFHEVHTIDDWDTLDTSGSWDIVFIDHAPDSHRHIEAKRLAKSARYIILHDSDPENDTLYQYSTIYPLFKYRFDYTACKPYTTVVSNFIDLENFSV